MSLTALDPRTALVVVDLQRGVTATPTAHPMDEVVERSAQLARAFREHDLPVVLVTVDDFPAGRNDVQQTAPARPTPPDGWTDLDERLQAADDDLRVVKQSWGAFHRTDLHEQLQGEGVTQVVLTGVATSIGVESTARSALDLGYHVVLVTDAMTDRSEASHRHSVEVVFPRLGETGTTDEVLAELG